MPEIGDTWTPSMPFPETERERMERRDREIARNRLKNEKRRQARELQKGLPKNRVDAGKNLRHVFGGAFGKAPENIKFMAAQGTTMDVQKEKESHGPHPQNQDGKIPEGETETDNE
jgi:hypothetical protein